jgi:hypothetical protein
MEQITPAKRKSLLKLVDLTDWLKALVAWDYLLPS